MEQRTLPRLGSHEWAAVLLTALGSLVLGVGWIIGLVLVCTSRAWNAVDKTVAVVVVAGWSIFAPFLLLSVVGYGPPAQLLVATMATMMSVPLVAAAYLALRARRR
jgi:hypothetical protein